MDEVKAQALHDELSSLVYQRGKSGGVGLGVGVYSWSVSTTKSTSERDDGLPNNPLYANFVREGSFNTKTPSNHGDGRLIKRNFDDLKNISDAHKSKAKKQKKRMSSTEKKAAKLEAKRQVRLAEKKAAKRAGKIIRKKSQAKEAYMQTKTSNKEKINEALIVDGQHSH